MKFRIIFIIVLLALSISCKREERGFRVNPPDTERLQKAVVTPLIPGGKAAPAHVRNQYEQNAYALSEGKRLFTAMNCTGCHANGGGGMGPALMDDRWIYGSAPEQIFATIVEGRPNGMPAFINKLPNYQVWQIAAYIRSMNARASFDAAPGRNDDMQGAPPENSRELPQTSISGSSQ